MTETMTCCGEPETCEREGETAVAERPAETTTVETVREQSPSEGTPARPAPEWRSVRPRIDGFASDEAYVVVADMPGVDESGVEITLEKDVLTIRGEADWPAPESFDHSYVEFPRRRFERTLRLADEVDRGGIEATIRNGVLRLTLPKTPEAKPTRIAVTAGA